MNILAIDTNQSRRQILEQKLRRMGYEVSGVSPGEELPEAEDFGLIVVSLIENVDFKTVRKLKESEALQNVPVIALTDSSNEEQVKGGIPYGITQYLVTPFTPNRLERKIKEALLFVGRKELREIIRKLKFITVSVDKGSETTLIELRGSLTHDVLREAEALFCRTFRDLVRNQRLLIDMRDLQEFSFYEVEILERLVELMESQNVSVIAGRHLGTIITASELTERVGVYGTYGEYRAAVRQQRQEG